MSTSLDLTPEQRAERNAAICAYYKAGHKIVECAEKFGLGRQRVHQILKAEGVWKPFDAKSTRTSFVGIHVTEDTKRKLIAIADKKNISLSLFAARVLEAVVNHKEIQR